MHKVLKKLYRDHAHFSRLIDMLEQQLDQLQKGGEANQALISEIVDYMAEYADAIHHPIEDQLYQIMLARSDLGKEPIEKLLSEHLITTELTRQLKLALDAMKQSGEAANDQVDKTGREMITHQRQHMLFEEKEAFPVLRDQLDDPAFDNAAAALPAEEDPLLDSNMKSRYPTLFNRMAQQ